MDGGQAAWFLRATLTFTLETIPAVTLELKSTHPDLRSGGSTLRLNGNSSRPASSPCASLGPELLDPLCQLPADEEGPQCARTPDSKLLLGPETKMWKHRKRVRNSKRRKNAVSALSLMGLVSTTCPC